jgi:hypothetical protein
MGDAFSVSAANSTLSLLRRSQIHKNEDWITFDTEDRSKNGESFTKRTSERRTKGRVLQMSRFGELTSTAVALRMGKLKEALMA